MPRPSLTAASLAAVGALALAGGAAAVPSEPATFGQHVAACAQMHLGQRAAAPAVTCVHDGVEMTFPTFGAMVEHMRGLHG